MAIDYPTYKFSEPFCSTGQKTVPPVTQTVTGNGRTSLKTGFPPETQKPLESGGLPPDRSDFNGILNALSQWVAWQGVGGSVKYEPTVTYPEGAMVFHNKRRWMCVKEATGQEPSAVSEYWQQFGELTGTIKMFASASTPAGYLPCDGRVVTKTQYPDLFAVIGYSWGGRGQQFNVPDLRNRFPMGATSGVGQYVMPEVSVPQHYHGFGYNTGGNSGNFVAIGDSRNFSLIPKSGTRGWNGSGGGGGYGGDKPTASCNMITTNAVAISSSVSKVQPPSAKVGFFIRY